MKKLALLLLLASCSRNPIAVNVQEPNTKTDGYQEYLEFIRGLVPDPQMGKGAVLNYTDSHGQKQGKWVEEFSRDSPFPENPSQPHFVPISRSMNYRNGVLDGSYSEYAKYVEEPVLTGRYKMGRKDGEWKYHLMGKYLVEVYKDGILQSTR